MTWTKPCRYHSYARQSCAACNAKPFDPQKNLALRALRNAWPDRSDSDKPGDVTDLRDGVVYVRPMSLTDVLEWVAREAKGEVRADD